MQALYEHAVTGAPCQEIVNRGISESPASAPAKEFAEELSRIWDEHGESVNAEIQKHLKEWGFDRLAKVDRSILQLALCELLFTKEAPAVVIDEAVELAKEYGGEESHQFVNGVLGAAYRARYNAEKAP